MDSRIRFLFFVLASCVAAYVGYQHSGRAPQLAGAEMVARQGEYQGALDESKRTGKPLVLDFYADWCGPCQWMKANTWSDSNVRRAMQRYVFVSVNVDHNPELSRLFGVSSIPRVVVISPAGKILASKVGAMPPDPLLSWLPESHPVADSTE